MCECVECSNSNYYEISAERVDVVVTPDAGESATISDQTRAKVSSP